MLASIIGRHILGNFGVSETFYPSNFLYIILFYLILFMYFYACSVMNNNTHNSTPCYLMVIDLQHVMYLIFSLFMRILIKIEAIVLIQMCSLFRCPERLPV